MKAYTTQTATDTVTITLHEEGYYDIYFDNGDWSLSGSATDVLNELTEDCLEQVKAFAEKNFSANDPALVVETGDISVTNPWVDESARFPLTDEQAMVTWGIRVVVDFCIKAMEIVAKQN